MSMPPEQELQEYAVLFDVLGLMDRGLVQRFDARNAEGKPVGNRSNEAATWSLTGAIGRAVAVRRLPETEDSALVWRVARRIARHLPKEFRDPERSELGQLVVYNDAQGRQKNEIVDLIRNQCLPDGFSPQLNPDLLPKGVHYRPWLG